MTDFKLTRNRDAWFVIRGYKYQIDLSILRWLALNDGQSLVLEFGEDIDIVNNALTSMIDRELEQIKHLDTPVTLRTPASKTALANAVSHFVENPGQELLFRFCTNASVPPSNPLHLQNSTIACDLSVSREMSLTQRRGGAKDMYESKLCAFAPLRETFFSHDRMNKK